MGAQNSAGQSHLDTALTLVSSMQDNQGAKVWQSTGLQMLPAPIMLQQLSWPNISVCAFPQLCIWQLSRAHACAALWCCRTPNSYQSSGVRYGRQDAQSEGGACHGALGLVDEGGLPRQHALIQAAAAVQDLAVHGDPLARQHAQHVPLADAGRGARPPPPAPSARRPPSWPAR